MGSPISISVTDLYARIRTTSALVLLGARQTASFEPGGIAVRLDTPDNYYVVPANALEKNVNFYRVVKGRRSQIKGVSTKVAPNQWHTLGLRTEGDRFTDLVRRQPLFTAEDKTSTEPGKIALWTKANSVTRFDALSVTSLE